SACCNRRILTATSQPRLRMLAALAPCVRNPVDAASGSSKITSSDFLLYQVTLASARSFANPRSTPPSNSFERSGLSTEAGFVVLAVSPPMLFWVGVLHVPCAMPPLQALENVCDVR